MKTQCWSLQVEFEWSKSGGDLGFNDEAIFEWRFFEKHMQKLPFPSRKDLQLIAFFLISKSASSPLIMNEIDYLAENV